MLDTNVELKKSEVRLRLLVACAKNYAISLLSPEDDILTWNKGAKQIKAFKAKERHYRSIFRYQLERALKDGSFEEEEWWRWKILGKCIKVKN